MIKAKDFGPEILEKSPWFSSKQDKVDDFNTLLAKANIWIEKSEVNVMNIETVVLPNMLSQYEEGSRDTDLRTSAADVDDWYQVIRVWYRD